MGNKSYNKVVSAIYSANSSKNCITGAESTTQTIAMTTIKYSESAQRSYTDYEYTYDYSLEFLDENLKTSSFTLYNEEIVEPC